MRIQRALLVVLAACSGGSDDLDPDVVTNLPPGDATGSAFGGNYGMSSVTTGCSGDCRTLVDGITYSACDIGTRLDDTITVTQSDGALVIDVDGNEYVSRLEGGVFADAMFEVGGLRTQLGGSVTITARVTGTFSSKLAGTARLRVRGQGLDCVIESDVTGEKR
jgi:hypothetical protein